jgi:hypothetical protein
MHIATASPPPVKSNPTSIDKTMHAGIDDRDQADGTD